MYNVSNKSIPLGSIVEFYKSSFLNGLNQALLVRHYSLERWRYEFFTLKDGQPYGLEQLTNDASDNDPLPVKDLNDLNIVITKVWVPTPNSSITKKKWKPPPKPETKTKHITVHHLKSNPDCPETMADKYCNVSCPDNYYCTLPVGHVANGQPVHHAHYDGHSCCCTYVDIEEATPPKPSKHTPQSNCSMLNGIERCLKECPHGEGYYECTMPKGHTYPHHAHNLKGTCLCVWDDEQAKPKEKACLFLGEEVKPFNNSNTKEICLAVKPPHGYYCSLPVNHVANGIKDHHAHYSDKCVAIWNSEQNDKKESEA